MVYDSVIACVGNTPLVRLSRLCDRSDVCVMAKLEMLNPGGSVKDRTAKYMIESSLQDGALESGGHLIESSSGNLGVAAAIVAKHHGLSFTCVVDPKICSANLTLLRLLGANVAMVCERDDTGGYLQARLRRVQELLDSEPGAVWLNQYANEANWRAHYETTAAEIISDLRSPPDCLVAAVSTTGTIMGIARRLKEERGSTRVVAVDAVGSAVFGSPAQARHVPGLGSGIVPAILDSTLIDEVMTVSSDEAVVAAHELVGTEGIFAGGSAGAVIAAVKRIVPEASSGYTIVAVLADRGERYLDNVYNTEWHGGRESDPRG